MNLKYTFINPNSVDCTAEVLLKTFVEANLSKVTHQDLVHYGIIPELAGRLPVITALDPVDEDMLVRIMTEPKNSVIKQYQALMGFDDVELEFEPEAIEEIADIIITI